MRLGRIGDIDQGSLGGSLDIASAKWFRVGFHNLSFWKWQHGMNRKTQLVRGIERDFADFPGILYVADIQNDEFFPIRQIDQVPYYHRRPVQTCSVGKGRIE